MQDVMEKIIVEEDVKKEQVKKDEEDIDEEDIKTKFNSAMEDVLQDLLARMSQEFSKFFLDKSVEIYLRSNIKDRLVKNTPQPSLSSRKYVESMSNSPSKDSKGI